MRKRFGKIFLILPLLFSFSVVAGEIRGIVIDSKTKEPVAGAIVFARSVANPSGVNTLTEDDGRYVFLNLPAGSYTVTANYAGAVAERTVVLADESSISEASLAVAASQAQAQGESYEITGTRIRSPNQTSLSPVTTVGEKDIKNQGATSIDTVINKLPQTFAAQGGTISNASNGTSNVNLGGLGASRSLVLIDGRRLGPGNPGRSQSCKPPRPVLQAQPPGNRSRSRFPKHDRSLSASAPAS